MCLRIGKSQQTQPTYFKVLLTSRVRVARWSSVPNSRATPTNSFSLQVICEPESLDIWPVIMQLQQIHAFYITAQ